MLVAGRSVRWNSLTFCTLRYFPCLKYGRGKCLKRRHSIICHARGVGGFWLSPGLGCRWCGPGRIWHRSLALRGSAAASDVRPELWGLGTGARCRQAG